jgi:hypothetical protein
MRQAIGYHFYFISGRAWVQFSDYKPAIVPEVFMAFLCLSLSPGKY